MPHLHVTPSDAETIHPTWDGRWQRLPIAPGTGAGPGGPGADMVEAGPWFASPCRPEAVVVAVGDVHGRSDLLTALDVALRGAAAAWVAEGSVVCVGDLIDRGPDSAGAIDQVRRGLAGRPTTCLLGNHEQMLLYALSLAERGAVAEAAAAFELWMFNGGERAAASWGLNPDSAARDPLGFAAALRAALGEAIAFLYALPVFVRSGNVVFVHAGIHPAQDEETFLTKDQRTPPDWDTSSPLWIREPFLGWDDQLPSGSIAVHGHTISAEPEFRPHRIGIDCGAALHGALCACVLRPDGAVRFVRARSASGWM